MRDRCCYVGRVTFCTNTELLVVFNICFCTAGNLDHRLECFNRIFTGSSFTGKHDRTCSLIDGIGNVCSLCTCRTWILDHGIQHLSCCDDLFAGTVYFGNNIFLNNRNIFKRDLNTHITTGNHDTVCGFDDTVDVVNTLLILDLCDDLNVVAAIFFEDIADLFDIGCCSGEGSSDEIISFFDAEKDIVMVFRADKWHIYLYARKVYTFFVAEDTTIYNGTDNVMTFDLFDFKSDQTIIDQNAVARFDIFI